MKIEHDGQKLSVSEISELSVVNSALFRDEVQAAMPPALDLIEIDLSQTRFIDSCGLGALFSLYKTAGNGRGKITLRLLNPTPPIQQLFELTQMHQLFEITHTASL
jgi:anti-sigma B factor antagonist